MNKYPGSFILNEIGTKKEIAAAYGVSERTVYRWLNKARSETGEKKPKPRRPRLSTLENFKGTRKELAKKYGVSERTVYRWLNKARDKGAEIPSRQKKKANDKSMPEEIITPDMLPEEVFTDDQLPEEIFTDDQLPEEIITPDQIVQEEENNEEFAVDEHGSDLLILNNLLYDNEMIAGDSIFNSFDKMKKLQYLDAYIKYQSDLDKDQFYDKETHDFNYSPDFVATINIWGDEFESWIRREEGLEDFADVWLD